jgi:type III pantothenate kinase
VSLLCYFVRLAAEKKFILSEVPGLAEEPPRRRRCGWITCVIIDMRKKMILAIDIGNTHMVLGCLNEKNETVKRVQMTTDRQQTYHEYAAGIRQVLQMEREEAVSFDGSILSSVVPEVTDVVAEAVRILTGKRPLVLGQGVETGLALDMNGLTADQIAGDLLATAVAAVHNYPLPAVVIDIGTATTMTVVSAEGVYLGGVILPGPGTSLQALVKDTSLLPAVDFSRPDKAIAKDTVNAMRAGIVYGSAGAIDGILDRFEEELGVFPTVLATGGMGRILAPYCRHRITVDDSLLLKGLGIIWRNNRKPAEKAAKPETV